MKREDNNNRRQPRLSPEEKKAKCQQIIKTLQNELSKQSLNLMELKKQSECDVGIKAFIHGTSKTHQPIIGNLKHKYEDFIVSEIDESGNVAKITNTESARDEHSVNRDKNADIADGHAVNNAHKELSEAHNEELASKFIDWYKSALKTSQNITVQENTNENTDNSKPCKQENDAVDEQQTNSIKTDNNDNLQPENKPNSNENTENEQDSVIKTEEKKDNDDNEEEDIDIDINKNRKPEKQKFTFPENKSKDERKKVHQLLKQLQYIRAKTNDQSCIEVEISRRKFSQERWPKSRGGYLKFILTKCGMDSTHCLGMLNKKLRKNSSKLFNVAGTKDKHAITSQWVTGYHVTCDEIKRAVESMNRVQIGNFQYVAEQIKLGSLSGNRFEIALRNIQYDESDEAKTSVSESEFNERLAILKEIGFINYFGMQRFGSSTVGTHQIGRAVIQKNLVLACSLLILPRALESEQIARGRQEFASSGDIRTFPNRLYTERSVMYGLIDDEKNYKQAMMKIPRNMRTMYTHAYQSYVWNHCVTHRIEQYGYKPVVGDLVRIKANEEEKKKIEVDEDEDEGGKWSNEQFEYVTKENIGEYTIFDVVWPLPHPEVKLPKLETTEYMKEMLKKDGLELNSFGGLEQDWGLHISYRNVVVHPLEMEGTMKMYESDEEYLIDGAPVFDNNRKMKTEEEMQAGDHDDGKKKKVAWIVGFGLPKSSYATMCLRQLLFIPSDRLSR